MCGSRPDAERVTASAGTMASSANPFSARYAEAKSLTPSKSPAGFDVPCTFFRVVNAVQELVTQRAQIRSPELAASKPLPRRMAESESLPAAREVLAQQRRADCLPGVGGKRARSRDQRAVRLDGKDRLRDAPHH